VTRLITGALIDAAEIAGVLSNVRNDRRFARREYRSGDALIPGDRSACRNWILSYRVAKHELFGFRIREKHGSSLGADHIQRCMERFLNQVIHCQALE